MSFPAYSEYKDSGVEWLGIVPSHWEVKRLREMVNLINGYPFDAAQFSPDQGLPLIRIRDLNAKEAAVHFDGDAVEAVIISGEDLLIGMDGDFNVGRWLGQGPALLNQRVCCLRTNARLSRLLEHALPIPLNLINDLTYATTVKHLSSGQVLDIRVAFPQSEPELAAIATFLDRETGKIDALVEEQERLIALLKEKRQAVISHAVTKGLNRDALTKDSGNKWLGDIPSHWTVMPLMRLTAPGRDIMYGIVLPGPDVGASGVPIVKGGDVKPHRLRLDLLNRTTPEIEEPFARARLNQKDIVYSIRGSIGDAEPVPPEIEGANITQDVARVSPRADISARWLLYVMKSKPIFVQLEQRSLGAAVRGINIFDLKRASVPVPPAIEQGDIADFLDSETRRIDDLLRTSMAGIALLQERRAALISAAVTGKIDVRASAKVFAFPMDRARARGLIAAEIIERSAQQRSFGRVKLQKIAFLAEAHVGIRDLAGSYTREAAGPLDRVMIDDMEREACRLSGIAAEQPDGAGTTVTYRLGTQRGSHREELGRWIGPERQAKLDKLIDDFATIETKGAEAVATLYAVWNDALMAGQSPDDAAIIAAFLNDWHPEKRGKFRANELPHWLDWMRRHDLVPSGTGPKTETGRLFV